MVKSPKKYTKLSGRSTMSVQTSYLAKDHLLVLDGYYTETERKLYYKDIEAILIVKTSVGTVWAVIAMIVAVLFTIGAFLNHEYGAWIGFAIPAVICAAFCIYTFQQLGSAILGVQTSVQTVTLDGVRTYRKARKIEAKLATRIEAVQGRLTKEALETALYKDATPAAAVPPMPAQSSADDLAEEGDTVRA